MNILNSKTKSALARLKKLKIFTWDDAEKAGLPRSTVSRLVAEGQIERLTRNVYKHPSTIIDPELEEFAVAYASLRPQAVISGHSALFHYRLLDRAPQQIWLLVPPGKRSHDPKITLIRTSENLSRGVEVHPLFKIASIERALVDAFRYAPKIGLQIAIQATRQAVREKKTTLAKILQLSKALKVDKYVMKHWEAIASEFE